VCRIECVSHYDPTAFIWAIFGCVVRRISSDTFCFSYFVPYSCFVLFNSSCSILVPLFFSALYFLCIFLLNFGTVFFSSSVSISHFLFKSFLFNLTVAFYFISPLSFFFLYCYFCSYCSATVAFLCFLPSLLIFNLFLTSLPQHPHLFSSFSVLTYNVQ